MLIGLLRIAHGLGRGSAEDVQDLRVDAGADGVSLVNTFLAAPFIALVPAISTALPHVKAGRVRGLGVTSLKLTAYLVVLIPVVIVPPRPARAT